MAKSRRAQKVRNNSHTAKQVSMEEFTEEDALKKIEEMENPFILILDGIQDPHNLGACMRSADAAGVDMVLSTQKSTVDITETVRTISCGAADNVPYVRVHNLNQTITRLKDMGIWLVGTGDEESQPIFDVELKGPLAIAMGSEALGLRAKVAEKCDFLAQIPMRGTVDCLNLSVATGVCLFEAVRQRTAK